MRETIVAFNPSHSANSLIPAGPLAATEPSTEMALGLRSTFGVAAFRRRESWQMTVLRRMVRSRSTTVAVSTIVKGTCLLASKSMYK